MTRNKVFLAIVLVVVVVGVSLGGLVLSDGDRNTIYLPFANVSLPISQVIPLMGQTNIKSIDITVENSHSDYKISLNPLRNVDHLSETFPGLTNENIKSILVVLTDQGQAEKTAWRWPNTEYFVVYKSFSVENVDGRLIVRLYLDKLAIDSTYFSNADIADELEVDFYKALVMYLGSHIESNEEVRNTAQLKYQLVRDRQPPLFLLATK